MKKKSIIQMILIFVFLFQISISAEEPLVHTRGMWMWGSQLGSQSTKTLVEKLRSNYVNKIYLLVKGGAGTKTSETALKDFIAEAHNQGIEVHLWYCVLEDNMYLLSHPEAHVYHCPKPGTNNNMPYMLNDDDNKVNLLYPGYKEYVLTNIEYFIKNFDSDGIHLDYIRYPHLVYSFDENHIKLADSLGCNTQRLLNLFLGDYDNMTKNGFISLYAAKDTDVVKWVNMRKSIVNDYVKSIRELMDNTKPELKLSASFMPEGAINKSLGDTHYAQNYSQNAPYLDEICIMSYFNSYNESPSWVKTVVQGALEEVSGNCRIIAGFQTFDNVTANQVKEQLIYAQKSGAHGAVGFRYGTTSSSQWAVIKERYKLYEPQTLINSEVLGMCGKVCDMMNENSVVPDSIFTDSTKTNYVSAAEFYYMMVNYLRQYGKYSKIPLAIPMIKNIAGPRNISGVQTESQIQLSDILDLAIKDADYIDSAKMLPDYIHTDTLDYDPAAMFWVYARTINWYKDNKVMPNYATVRECEGPSGWYVTAVGQDDNVPSGFSLMQNFPNPFNPSTEIKFSVAEGGYVKLKVFDILGNDIATLYEGEAPAGTHKLSFNAGALTSGVYFYRCETVKETAVKKMLLVR